MKTSADERPAAAAAPVADAPGGAAAGLRRALEQGRAQLHDAQDAAGAALKQARSAAQSLGERAGTAYRQGARATEDARRNVEQNPLTALLIAGAIGYGLSYLVHRGSRAWRYEIVRVGSQHRLATGRFRAPTVELAKQRAQTVSERHVDPDAELDVRLLDERGREVWRGPYTGSP